MGGGGWEVGCLDFTPTTLLLFFCILSSAAHLGSVLDFCCFQKSKIVARAGTKKGAIFSSEPQ